VAVERAQAQQGETARLRADFRLGGTLFDPFEIRQVEILDDAFVVLATLSGASIVKDAVGQYHVDWPVPAAEATTLHYDRWYSTASSGATEKQGTLSFFVHSATVTGGESQWLSNLDLLPFLPTGTILTDVEIAENALLAQEMIESICGQKFTLLTEARDFSGQGEQILNVRTPIQSVTEVRILGCPPGTGDQVLEITDLRIGRSQTVLALGNVVPKRYRVGGYLWPGGCSYFPYGFQNIRVTGTWGAFTEVPREIKRALGLLVRHIASCDDPVGSPAEAYDSENVAGDRSYTIRKVWHNVTQDATTGFADVDSILARYYAAPTVTAV
jgi:hypothetical protein